MVLKYPLVVYIGVPVVLLAVAAVHLIKRKREYKVGTRVANTFFIKEDKRYKSIKTFYTSVAVIAELALVVSMIAALVLISRPVVTEKQSNGTKKRDIFLCMDVSYSIYDLNYDLVDSLEEVVKSLDGDRFGVTIYNTSSVLYVPMTDDYDFIISKLEELKDYFVMQREYMQKYEGKYFSEIDYDEYTELKKKLDYYDAGTLINNYQKGSSLIGEGLATALYSFPRLDEQDRTRIIIMSTDNAQEALSKPLVEVEEACDLCAGHDIKVFGIFPSKEKYYDKNRVSYDKAMSQLQAAVQGTGGTFYSESNTLSVAEMVDDIEKQEALVVDEITVTRVVDKPVITMIVLAISMLIFFMCGVVLNL